MSRILSAGLACLSLFGGASAARETPKNTGKQWALLMAGSNTWGNYRHQADTYHAYQILKEGGLADENIIVMHYDDVAGSSQNPMPGKVINKPDGSDVYHGVPKDYVGSDVTAANFLAALAGNASATTVNGVQGAGKVIASGPDDTVFVAFFDHGGPGILGVPMGAGPFIYAKDVNDQLQYKATSNQFKELVFYIEACESGSIFQGMLPSDSWGKNIYALTAANAQESSWGYYCPGMDPPPPSGFNTCLGDLFSISWMEDTDAHDTSRESLNGQYTRVKTNTSNPSNPGQGSHVMRFGDAKKMKMDKVGEFMGDSPIQPGALLGAAPKSGEWTAERNEDAALLPLKMAVAKAQSDEEKTAAQAKLDAAHAERASLAAKVQAVAAAALGEEKAHMVDAVVAEHAMGFGVAAGVGAAPAGGLVHDWACYKAGVEAFRAQCVPADATEPQHVLRHTRVFAKLCNAGVSGADIIKAAGAACASAPKEADFKSTVA